MMPMRPRLAVLLHLCCWGGSALAAPEPSPLPAHAAASAPASAEQAGAEAGAEPGAEAKIAPLLGMVLSQVGSFAFEAAVGDTPSGLFKRLWNRLRGQEGSTTVHAPSPNTVAALSASQAARAGDGRLVPAIGYSLEQLDPVSFATLRQLEVGKSPPALKTGDVFVLRYATSLPGQVRLENIDSTGQIGDLGSYTVWPDRINRLPHDRGIRLDGAPGPEIIRVYFYPCLPTDTESQVWAAALKDKLSPCGQGLAGPMVAAGKGSVRTKAMTSLAQPDPGMAFAGTADYQQGDVVSAVVMLRHEAR